MRPNMGRIVRRSASPYTVKTITRQTVDFVESDVVAGRTVKALIQPARKSQLNPEMIDWSLRYITIHSLGPVDEGELIEYGGEDYKIIELGDYQDFGYTEAVAEQTKRPVVQVTE